MHVWEEKSKLVIFSGMDKDNNKINDLWFYDIEKMKFE